MGMQHVVDFGDQSPPTWTSVRDLLSSHGINVQMRMIDGSLAFPDELPTETWQELRIGTAGGMLTMRRAANTITIVTWGNADEAMTMAWNGLAWAFAEAGRGQINGESPGQFRQSAHLSFGVTE